MNALQVINDLLTVILVAVGATILAQWLDLSVGGVTVAPIIGALAAVTVGTIFLWRYGLLFGHNSDSS